MNNPALDTLFYPFEKDFLARPEGAALFINGLYHPSLTEFDDIYVQQSFAPFVRALEEKNIAFSPEAYEDKAFKAVLVLGTKNVQETRFMMAQGLEALEEGGLFMIAAANDAGGKRLSKDLETLGLETEEESKNKCRVVWAHKTAHRDDETINTWTQRGQLQTVLDGAYISQPGLFSWDRVDKGSVMLADYLENVSLSGIGADFGCGYGYLSKNILQNQSGIKELYYIDADHRAVSACARNLAGFPVKSEGVWHDLTVPLPDKGVYDFIVMNPPFHEGKSALPLIGQGFIENAALSLRVNGILYMVANRHLPYEDILSAHFKKYEIIIQKDGFKLFKATK